MHHGQPIRGYRLSGHVLWLAEKVTLEIVEPDFFAPFHLFPMLHLFCNQLDWVFADDGNRALDLWPIAGKHVDLDEICVLQQRQVWFGADEVIESDAISQGFQPIELL